MLFNVIEDYSNRFLLQRFLRPKRQFGVRLRVPLKRSRSERTRWNAFKRQLIKKKKEEEEEWRQFGAKGKEHFNPFSYKWAPPARSGTTTTAHLRTSCWSPHPSPSAQSLTSPRLKFNPIVLVKSKTGSVYLSALNAGGEKKHFIK